MNTVLNLLALYVSSEQVDYSSILSERYITFNFKALVLLGKIVKLGLFKCHT